MKLLIGVLVGLALSAATVSGVLHLLGVGSRESSWRPIGQVVLLSAAWLLSNSALEVRVLWSPAPSHGLTVADLAVLPCLAVGALLLVRQLS
jgi:hypothetical protein